jgi:Uma2 family endonuclease
MTVANVLTPSLDRGPLLLNVSNALLKVTPEHFDQLCIDNPDLRLELTKDGELIVMVPVGGESGEKNGDLFGEVWYWNRQSHCNYQSPLLSPKFSILGIATWQIA